MGDNTIVMLTGLSTSFITSYPQNTVVHTMDQAKSEIRCRETES